jgi:hypothetical protein
MTITEPFSFTPPPPPVNHNFVIGEVYLIVTKCHSKLSSIGTVIDISERSLSIQCVINGYNAGKHVISLDFIDFSFSLSSLIPGRNYRFYTNTNKVFEASFIDILHLFSFETPIFYKLIFVKKIFKNIIIWFHK